MKKYVFLLLGFAAFQSSAQQVKISKSIQQAMNRIDTNTIRSHIAYLADDKLKGRLPGTEGYQMAVDYVVDQYKKMGVAPGGDNGGYTQKLILRRSLLNNKSSVAVLKDANGNIDSLDFAVDYTAIPHPMLTSAAAQGQLVFAGYGVEIPGQYSDYTGIDVKGKIVVLVAGAPDGLISTLTAHFSNAGNKMNTAFTKGAIGAIIINLAVRPSGNVAAAIQSNVAVNPEKTAAYGRAFTGNLKVALNGSKSLLSRLFMHSGKNMEQVLADIKKSKASSFALPYSISVSYNTSHTDFESYNVVGLIPGSDNVLKNEYVVHSAHLDHVGIGRAVNGDSIYNGAHDNASGVASLLEIARIYKTSGAKPKRSVLIVMVTAEEMGLVGSSYFAANPTVPKASIVADVNTDMPTVIAPLLSVVPLGAEHSSIMNNVKFAASYLKLDVEKDPEPEQNRFVRSDQYSFVMNGIPALHIKYGNKTNIPGFDLDAFVKQWRAKYYHQSADGLDGIFNFTAAKTYVQLNFLISYSIAQTTERPKWNAGDLFGAVQQ
ncbi:M28 family peptidase [Lacibacter sediminis]|uniref:M20/M25/M40 family metallo-hydrolase n=1 Tax=Lacibacter sediminis TaxID=2760713 RepID=A0A7G5XCF4_9BACT|nr:M28 family peptidase [Lacibacter sediminis]QNA43157.1 M20/M25/M40 family metallo-hydrolase [Lacibacter sediminis]